MSNFIPKNMNKKNEFLDGIGLKQVWIVIRIMGYGIIFSFLLYLFLDSIIVFLLPLMFLFIGGLSVSKKSDFLGLSIYETRLLEKQFRKRQKLYFYEYKKGGMKFD